MNLSPVIILVGVFVLTAFRQTAGIRLQIWQIMLAGAIVTVAAGDIAPAAALKSVNADVMLFLFGMFIVGAALVESGYLYHVSYGLFKRATNTDGLILSILFVMGFFSAFLLNDTIAVIGTPLVLFFSARHNVSHKLLLLTLCFATTIGSVLSPIGNPQNLLIAISGEVPNPFFTFLKYLAVPTVINLFLAYLFLKFFYKDHFHKRPLEGPREGMSDRRLAGLSRLSLMVIAALAALKIAFVTLDTGLDFSFTYIALFAAAPIVAFSDRRLEMIRRIDWHTLVFFAALFILMESVWQSGVMQAFLASTGLDLASTGLILAVSVLLSQLLSNVPFVALYLPVLAHLGATPLEMAALAAGSTIAGNLLILGAASNIIVIQNAEKRGFTLGFFEFARVGIPLTAANIFVYWAYLSLVRW